MFGARRLPLGGAGNAGASLSAPETPHADTSDPDAVRVPCLQRGKTRDSPQSIPPHPGPRGGRPIG